MKKISIIIFFCFSLLGYSQEKLNIQEIFNRAYQQHKSRDYVNAIKNYTIVIENIQQKEIRKQLFIKRGLAKNSIKKYSSAIIDFTEAIKLDSTDMASFVDRGLSYYYNRNLQKSETDFLFVVNKNTNRRMSENSLYWLTKIQFLKNDFKKAISYSNKLIEGNSNDAEFYFLRGAAYGGLIEYKKAIRDYDKALKIKSNYVQALTNRGVAKINLITGKGNVKPSKRKTKSACKDLKRAYELGDKANTGDLIFIYCK